MKQKVPEGPMKSLMVSTIFALFKCIFWGVSPSLFLFLVSFFFFFLNQIVSGV